MVELIPQIRDESEDHSRNLFTVSERQARRDKIKEVGSILHAGWGEIVEEVVIVSQAEMMYAFKRN